MLKRRQFVSTLVASSIIAPLAHCLASASVDNAQWDPSSTWVFVVGVLKYPEGEAWPQEGRRDAVMIEQLKKVGVPSSQVEFIKDQAATLSNVKNKFARFLAKIPVGGTLWFYFAGHGDKSENGMGSFVLYDADWTNQDVYRAIEKNFKGNQAMLFADCCYSGSLGEYIKTQRGKVAYAALSSSNASTVSTGAWTFTNCLITGLQGVSFLDTNNSGWIDFAKLASFAEREMAAIDGQLSTFVVANGFNQSIKLVPAMQRENPIVGTYVNARSSDGKVYVGRVEAVNGQTYLIRWGDYDESANEWVNKSDTKKWTPNKLPNGTKVLVEWKGKWYSSTILGSKNGSHLIHYDGYDSNWDEWVPSERLKLANS